MVIDIDLDVGWRYVSHHNCYTLMLHKEDENETHNEQLTHQKNWRLNVQMIFHNCSSRTNNRKSETLSKFET